MVANHQEGRRLCRVGLNELECKKGREVFPAFFLAMFCSEAVVQGALIVARERKHSSE